VKPKRLEHSHVKVKAGRLPVDGGGEKDEVGAKEVLDHGQRDGGGLIHDNQLRLRQSRVVRRLNVPTRVKVRCYGIPKK